MFMSLQNCKFFFQIFLYFCYKKRVFAILVKMNFVLIKLLERGEQIGHSANRINRIANLVVV
jgi:hypothetical protein